MKYTFDRPGGFTVGYNDPVVDIDANAMLQQALTDITTGTTYKTLKERLDAKATTHDSLISDLQNYLKSKTLANIANARRTHYLLYDGFDRDDSTVDLGKCESTLNPYTYDGTSGAGTFSWGISGKTAMMLTGVAGNRYLAYQETYVSDAIIEVDLKNIGNGVGIVFRLTDNANYIACTVSPTYMALYKRVGGVYTLIKDISPVTDLGHMFGDCKLTIKFKGQRIDVYMDGFLLMSRGDSFNQSATKHGLFSSFDTPGAKWKNFNIRPDISNIPLQVYEDFETPPTNKWYWGKESADMTYSQTYSTTIKKSGTQSLRIELHKDDPDVASSKRCEISLRSEEPLEEHWYGVSIYLPGAGSEEYLPDPAREILIQWHNTPDGGESWTSPPLSLMTENDQYVIGQLWDDNRLSTNAQIAANHASLNTYIGSFTADKGRWVDWLFHVKWGWKKEQNPITEVYKDGKLVYEMNGVPNVTNDRMGVYPKLGIYKWTWKDPNSGSVLTKRVVYYDEYFIK